MKKDEKKERVKFFTFGCKVNQYETQSLREQFIQAGWWEPQEAYADVYVVNTCTVTHHAQRESRRAVRRVLAVNPRAQVIVSGCLVEQDAEEIRQISDRVIIVPNRDKNRVISYLNNTSDQRPATSDKTFLPLKISSFQGHHRAFVKIQDGCDNFCAYCKVPFVRGRSRSRSFKAVKEEVRVLLDKGFREIVLCGICLGDYHHRHLDLAGVLEALRALPGDFRIRLSSVEPQLVTAKLISLLQAPKVCVHLHLPLQSGDDRILKKMKRRYTRAGYLELVTRLKKKVKDIAITTDLLIGFPGEQEADFRRSLSCLKEVLPLRTHVFPFSPRPDTRAFAFSPRVRPEVIKARAALAKEAAGEYSLKFRRQFFRRRLTVLAEGQVQPGQGGLCGYTENYIRTVVEDAGPQDSNKLLAVQIKSVDAASTCARIVR